MERKTLILSYMDRSRRALQRAAGYGCPDAYAAAVAYAGRMLAEARRLMAEAPASTRRRWKASAVIATRKAYARTMNRAGGSGINRAGRIVYRNI